MLDLRVFWTPNIGSYYAEYRIFHSYQYRKFVLRRYCHIIFHLVSDIISHNDRKSSIDIAGVHYLLGCDAVQGRRRFGGICCHHFLGRR